MWGGGGAGGGVGKCFGVFHQILSGGSDVFQLSLFSLKVIASVGPNIPV